MSEPELPNPLMSTRPPAEDNAEEELSNIHFSMSDDTAVFHRSQDGSRPLGLDEEGKDMLSGSGSVPNRLSGSGSSVEDLGTTLSAQDRVRAANRLKRGTVAPTARTTGELDEPHGEELPKKAGNTVEMTTVVSREPSLEMGADDVLALRRATDSDGEGEPQAHGSEVEPPAEADDTEKAEPAKRSSIARVQSQKSGILKKFLRGRGRRESQSLTSHQKQKHSRLGKLLTLNKAFLPDSRWRRYYNVIQLAVISYFFFTSVLIILPNGAEILRPLGLRFDDCECTTEDRRDTAIVDFAMTALHVVHIAITFNTAYTTSSELVEDRQKIAWNYIKSLGFVADVLSSIPLDTILLLSGAQYTAFRVFRALRFLSVAHLRRLFLMSNPNMMSAHYVEYYFTVVPLLLFTIYGIGMLHVLVSIRIAFAHAGEALNYYDSFKWVINILLNSNVFAPQIDTFPQEVYALVLTFLAIIVQSAVVGKVTLVLLKADVGVQIEERMRETLEVLQHYKIPRLLQEEVLAFQFHALQNELSSNFASTLGSLPPVMQDELAVYIRIGMVEKVPMFASSSMDCKFLLARGLKRVFHEPRQHIISAGEDGDCMYFLSHGFADVVIGADLVVATLKSGQFFGEIALLQHCKRTANIVSLTYCELYRLDKVDFDAIMDLYADFYDAIQAEKERRNPPPPPKEPTVTVHPPEEGAADEGEALGDSPPSPALIGVEGAASFHVHSGQQDSSLLEIAKLHGKGFTPEDSSLSVEEEERKQSVMSSTSAVAVTDVGEAMLRQGALDRTNNAHSTTMRGMVRARLTTGASIRGGAFSKQLRNGMGPSLADSLGSRGDQQHDRSTSPRGGGQRRNLRNAHSSSSMLHEDDASLGTDSTPQGNPTLAKLAADMDTMKAMQAKLVDMFAAHFGEPHQTVPSLRDLSRVESKQRMLQRIVSKGRIGAQRGSDGFMDLAAAQLHSAHFDEVPSSPRGRGFGDLKEDNTALAENDQLLLTVVRVHRYPRRDPYFRVFYPPNAKKELAQTQIHRNQPNAEFNETFKIPITTSRNVVKLDCRDWERIGTDVHVGDLFVDLRRRGEFALKLDGNCEVVVKVHVEHGAPETQP